MRKFLACLLALMTLCCFLACETAESAAYPSTSTVEPVTESAIKTVYDTSVYASMTEEELYAEALKEGGKLIVYTETGSTERSLEGFRQLYPGIDVEITKYKNYELNTKAELEFTSGTVYADVLIGGDSSGEKYMDWYDKGYVFAYVPDAIRDDIYPAYLTYGLPVTVECAVWYYSTAMYPDACPIGNWWDIVETDESGNSKYRLFLNGIENDSTCGVLCNLIQRSTELEAAYRDKYGEDIVYTYDAAEWDVEPHNAGYEWLYRLLQCDYTVINDSAEIIAAVNGSELPALGLSTTLKYGDALEAGEQVFFTTDLQPFNGFAKVKYIYITSQTDNPAGAGLLALYSLGGTDGQGAGYSKYADRNGVYGVRFSHDDTSHSDVALETLNILPSDIAFVYEEAPAVRDFWTLCADRFA